MSGGKGVLLGAYPSGGVYAFQLSAMPPEDCVRHCLDWGERIHGRPYRDEFETGVSVAWHRVPWTLGCAGSWTQEKRAAHYDNLCAIDNRLVLAGEHASYLPAWQEGAVLSAYDATERLHRRVMGS
ncbi:flavin monoamine oxidase family protein [Falsiroseomonas sp. HW251]|uniref:flavin monoamine oxidase family protein n=1 Tax=Falsiroseomonas sp. HW251 TaxID=3390998 RepID=UPI003D3151FC